MPHYRSGPDHADDALTKTQFLEQFAPRYGTTNPTRMEFDFWRLMVESGHSPQWARDRFGLDLFEAYPVWCFQREGMTETTMSDGRVLFVAGKHEIYRDPDFHLYNDVIVRHPDGRVEILGYPARLFPPTGFHTATLVEGAIYLIGSRTGDYDSARLGDDRSWRPPAQAQVMRLDTATYEIARVATHGDDPGWIASHDAEWLPSEKVIYVADGQIIAFRDGNIRMEPTPGEFLFSPASGRWSRVT